MYVNAVSLAFSVCVGQFVLFISRNAFFFTAPGQVEDLQLNFDPNGDPFNSITRMYTLDMIITWREPINPNGVITSYEVTVTQTNDVSDIIYSDRVTVNSVTQSVMVLPFTDYTVTVTASTSAGQGDPESVAELSPEAGTQTCSIVFLLSVHLHSIVHLVVG